MAAVNRRTTRLPTRPPWHRADRAVSLSPPARLDPSEHSRFGTSGPTEPGEGTTSSNPPKASWTATATRAVVPRGTRRTLPFAPPSRERPIGVVAGPATRTTINCPHDARHQESAAGGAHRRKGEPGRTARRRPAPAEPGRVRRPSDALEPPHQSDGAGRRRPGPRQAGRRAAGRGATTAATGRIRHGHRIGRRVAGDTDEAGRPRGTAPHGGVENEKGRVPAGGRAAARPGADRRGCLPIRRPRGPGGRRGGIGRRDRAGRSHRQPDAPADSTPGQGRRRRVPLPDRRRRRTRRTAAFAGGCKLSVARFAGQPPVDTAETGRRRR